MNTRSTRSRANAVPTAVPPATVEIEKAKRRPRKKSEAHTATTEISIQVTPPKQGRYSRNPNSEYSPSTLLNRLSMNDEEVENEEKPIIPRKSKIENARKVLNIAETDNLYGREREVEELTAFLENHLKNGTSASMYVSGQPGKK